MNHTFLKSMPCGVKCFYCGFFFFEHAQKQVHFGNSVVTKLPVCFGPGVFSGVWLPFDGLFQVESSDGGPPESSGSSRLGRPALLPWWVWFGVCVRERWREWNLESSLPLERFRHQQIPSGINTARKLSVFLALWGRRDPWAWNAKSGWEIFWKAFAKKKKKKKEHQETSAVIITWHARCIVSIILQILFRVSNMKGWVERSLSKKFWDFQTMCVWRGGLKVRAEWMEVCWAATDLHLKRSLKTMFEAAECVPHWTRLLFSSKTRTCQIFRHMNVLQFVSVLLCFQCLWPAPGGCPS